MNSLDAFFAFFFFSHPFIFTLNVCAGLVSFQLEKCIIFVCNLSKLIKRSNLRLKDVWFEVNFADRKHWNKGLIFNFGDITNIHVMLYTFVTLIYFLKNIFFLLFVNCFERKRMIKTINAIFIDFWLVGCTIYWERVCGWVFVPLICICWMLCLRQFENT